MQPRRILALLACGGLLLGAALWLAWLWYADPARSVERRWNQLLDLAEKRRWEKIEERLSPQFSNPWGHDRAASIALAEEAFRQFLFVRFLRPDSVEVEHSGPHTILLKARLEIEGSGSPLAQIAIRQLQETPGRFLFTFVREESGPDGWMLVQLDHENQLPW